MAANFGDLTGIDGTMHTSTGLSGISSDNVSRIIA
eukprot:CAMPEP_0179211624 /NCGR_PEP_ID=MMETSP0797-20121207/580_1 /TAXON_ID=47934 /ORGANISM="Dinophysis acuminata, Strain DAEP01" /LENGTH=34 /DNA_ID= /DNA_START= /DNA_END= /DNA_ORIENTATION=